MGYLLIVSEHDEFLGSNLVSGLEADEVGAVGQISYININFIFSGSMIVLDQILNLISTS